MNKFKLTTIAAAIALACSAGAMAAPEAAKDDAKAAAAAKNESPGAYVDDSVITGKVKAAVLGEASLKSAEINVETFKGIVQLSGFVKSRADIDKVVKIAHSVKGVTSVKNDMIVKGQQ
jgi:hyperosmotically inducible protein